MNVNRSFPSSQPAIKGAAAPCAVLLSSASSACSPSDSMPLPAPSKALLLLAALLVHALPLRAAQGDRVPTDGAPRGAISLVPFHSVFSCLPFSLLIRPSGCGGAPAADGGAPAADGAPAYRLLLDTADANIAGAFDYGVTPDGTLHLNLATPVATNSCASAVVELPADALREVRQPALKGQLQRGTPPGRARSPCTHLLCCAARLGRSPHPQPPLLSRSTALLPFVGAVHGSATGPCHYRRPLWLVILWCPWHAYRQLDVRRRRPRGCDRRWARRGAGAAGHRQKPRLQRQCPPVFTPRWAGPRASERFPCLPPGCLQAPSPCRPSGQACTIRARATLA